MTVSFLTTYRRSDEYRLANLEKVIDRTACDFPDWEIVVVEQDEKSTLDSHPLLEKVTYIHAHNPGPFNKSWGMNLAYQQSNSEILVFGDADMIVLEADLSRAVDACAAELDVVRPYSSLIDMTPEETEHYMQYGRLPGVPDKDRGFNRAHAGEALCIAGGIFVIRREYFTRVGGFDERFSGWGAEDDAMSLKLLGLSTKVAIARNVIAWHLWHPRDGRYAHKGYETNSRLLQEYRNLDRRDLFQLAQKQLKTIGQPEKYQEVKQYKKTPDTRQEIAGVSSLIIKNLPENYGEVLSSGEDFTGKKFAIIIPVCGRPEYLERCLQSLAKSDLSRAVICIIDETLANKQYVDGFTCFEGIDSPELDIKQVQPVFENILAALQREPECNAFNEQGWLKHTLQPVTGITTSYSRQGLYIRDFYLDCHDLRDELDALTLSTDNKAEELIRRFLIPGVPCLKVFKATHKNMHDSLRVGWDLMDALGCEFLINLDSDTLVCADWLNKLEFLYLEQAKERASSAFIVSGFNSSIYHQDTDVCVTNAIQKKSIGGVNLFFHHSLYRRVVRESLSSVFWDHRLSERLLKKNIPIFATRPSVVQHIGLRGLWSSPWNFDEAKDFTE